MQARIGTGPRFEEIPRKQRRPMAKPLEYYGQRFRQRDRAIAEAYLSGAYTMRTQGEPEDDLREHLADLYKELTSGTVPNVRRVAELDIA